MAKTIIGLDIGTWSIKVAVLESTLRGTTLVDFIEKPIPRGPGGEPVDPDVGAHVALALRGILDWDGIATAIPGHQAITRQIELPFSDDRRIQSVLGFQLEGQFPMDLEDLVYDYYPLKQEDEESLLLCAAVEKSWLQTFLSSLGDVNADPKSVTLRSLCYGTLLTEAESVGEDEVVAVVDMGHLSTTVAVIGGGRVQTVRSVSRGGHHTTLALMEATGGDYGQAERIKHEGVRLDGHVPNGVSEAEASERLDAVRRSLQPTVRDVKVTLHAHANRWGTSISRVLLCGGAARMEGMEQTMAATLGLPATRWDVTGVEWCEASVNADQAVSLPSGLALGLRQIEDSTVNTVNFRQGELAYESDYKVWRDRAGWFATIAFLLLSSFLGRQYITYNGLKDNHALLVDQLRSFSEQVLDEPRDDFDFVLKRLERPPAAEASTLFPEMSAFKTFFDVTTAQDVVNRITPEQTSTDEDKDKDKQEDTPSEAVKTPESESG
ncbi:MAG: pilus assembly protein PilM, partial [Myxococcota bacterium]|nr:pilus assembly protein PilM [Myxococcota bacterium]